MENNFTDKMARDRVLIEDYLKKAFAAEPRYADLQEAMEYSLLAGGKRIRPILTLEEAKAKALAHAGLKADQVTFTEAELDWDDGKQVYDIEFYTADFKEYDYEIDAKTGEVLEVDYDAESFTPPASSGTVITREKAQEIALAKVPGADASHIKKLKLDKDDGKQVYDVEIIYNGAEHEMEIDAVTGKILEYEMDRD